MKIQFFGNNTFGAFGKDSRIIFDPTDTTEALFSDKLDFTTNSSGQFPQNSSAKKNLTLPGEYEISDILVKSIAQKKDHNVIFKVVVEELVIVHCGNMIETPDKNLFENLGEDIDVLIVNISEKFPAKKIKDLLETIEPRVAFIGGDSSKFADLNSIIQLNMSGENPISVSRSSLSEEKSEYYILPV